MPDMTNPHNHIPTTADNVPVGVATGGVTALWILTALAYVAGVLLLSKNGIAPLVVGGVAMLSGTIMMTGAIVATHIGARLDRR